MTVKTESHWGTSRGPHSHISELPKVCTRLLHTAQAAGKGSPTAAWQGPEWDRARAGDERICRRWGRASPWKVLKLGGCIWFVLLISSMGSIS